MSGAELRGLGERRPSARLTAGPGRGSGRRAERRCLPLENLDLKMIALTSAAGSSNERPKYPICAAQRQDIPGRFGSRPELVSSPQPSSSCRPVFRNRLRLLRSKFFPRQHRKKSVPARRAPVHRQIQEEPKVFQRSFTMFRGDSLQLESAAPPAMHVSQESNGHAPRKKTQIAIPASPRPNLRKSKNIVQRAAPARPLAIVALALRTNQISTPDAIRALKNRPAPA